MSEHETQVALMQWARYNEVQYPALAMLFAVPNGGKREKGTGDRLRDEGVQRGVPDLMLPFPVRHFHGFFLELKHGRNKPTPEQLEWIEKLRGQGYCVEVAWDWEAAADKIVNYLEGRS